MVFSEHFFFREILFCQIFILDILKVLDSHALKLVKGLVTDQN